MIEEDTPSGKPLRNCPKKGSFRAVGCCPGLGTIKKVTNLAN
jgi:hypothetical protein